MTIWKMVNNDEWDAKEYGRVKSLEFWSIVGVGFHYLLTTHWQNETPAV